ncbi:hypothetical protein Pla123a_27880 [Posidoniimonas polymericola]|uniref:Methyltransferase domain-containing protein n=1 Tax=Posidoniimonas polymericola TaxID=2528002 RepID=A0A5C5YM69_9BACT|nr:methyltransferase domain-containing protein [Posidoniimonas polymericola]TWT76002.1 hypothetical protein Pla123a_27880 [Posidoniimonas polymericola]
MQRVLTPELLDDPALDESLHQAAYAGLRRINTWSRTASYLRRELSRIAAHRSLTELRVLDVACGSGDMARSLAARPLAGGVRLEVDGCDISPAAVEQAQQLADRAGQTGTRFYVHDALAAPFPHRYDVVLCTLFLHHMTESQGVALFRQMAAAAEAAVLVDDLIRSRIGYWLAWTGCRILSRSTIVHNDGPVSVRGAFTPEEAVALAAEAGLPGARCKLHWPQRYLLTWEA